MPWEIIGPAVAVAGAIIAWIIRLEIRLALQAREIRGLLKHLYKTADLVAGMQKALLRAGIDPE